MPSKIPLWEPKAAPNEWHYVKKCLDSRWVSSAGAFVDRFEALAAEKMAVRHAVAAVNGTAALHTALLVAGIRPDEEVLMPALSFIAPANTICYAGAYPVFLDVDAEYWQLDPEAVEKFIRTQCSWKRNLLMNTRTRRRVTAILPVDILGHPTDMRRIAAIAKKYKLKIIEDATESIGALYHGKPLGGYADITCLSFNGNKLITCGGGGMLLTNRKEWAMKAKYLTTQAKDEPIKYIHKNIGFNYRLTNLQAAMGCAQMECLSSFVKEKRRDAVLYREGLARVPGISFMKEARWAKSTFWLNTLLVDARRYGMSADHLRRKLISRGIETRFLWQPLNESPAHKAAYSFQVKNAGKIFRTALCLPSSVGLTESDIARVVATVKK